MKLKHLLLLIAIMTSMNIDAQNHCKACDWLASGVWANGFKTAPDKSVNAKEFKEQYTKNKELWDKVFTFLANNDLESLPVGTTDIEKGRAWVTVSEYVPNPAEKQKIESHRRFIDLQYTLRGNEKMGLARDKDPGVLMEYNDKREVAFWTSKNIEYFKAGPETFFLFFPSDLHQPSVLDGEPVKSKKIVVKIEYAE